MEMLDVNQTQWLKRPPFPQTREYDQKIELRAEKHKGLRGRNNATSCRSPSRELDTRWIKMELKRKRQQEFHQRRSVSPERANNPVRDNGCVICNTAKSETPGAKVTTTLRSGMVRNSARIKNESCVMCDGDTTGSLPGNVTWPLTARPTVNRHSSIVSRRTRETKDDLAEREISEWASMWNDQTPIRETTKNSTRKLEMFFSTLTTSTQDTSSTSTLNGEPHTSTTTTSTLTPHTTPSTPSREPVTSTPKPNRTATPFTSIKEIQPRLKTFANTEKGVLKVAGESNRSKKTLTEASAQTEPGFITVKESEVLQLADYLQEALWREEGLKRKLAVIQRSSSTLLLHTDKLWTSRCNEDLLKTSIKALESQLQVCLKKQKLPQDGVKTLTLQMEVQKEAYEGKALEAIQRATEEKNRALIQAETVEMLLQAAREEAARWQGQYERMRARSEQLDDIRKASADQLLQLHNQLELVWAQEAGLREELQAMRRVEEELRYNVTVLEERNQSLAREVQMTKDASNVVQDSLGEPSAVLTKNSEELEPNLGHFSCLLEEQKEKMENGVERVEQKEEKMEETVDDEEEEVGEEEEEGQSGDGGQVVEQLRHTQERLRLKERECEELQGELEVMETECQSCQVRLAQCREELRLLNQRHRSKVRPGVSWPRLCVFLLLLLTVVTAAILWAWHPSLGDQVRYLCSVVVEHIEDYLPHSACFRPI